MNKNSIKYIVIFLFIIPIFLGLILSCTNFDDNYISDNKTSSVDGLYIPDTINNRKEHVIKKSNTFTYICIFSLLSLFGIVYITAFQKKE